MAKRGATGPVGIGTKNTRPHRAKFLLFGHNNNFVLRHCVEGSFTQSTPEAPNARTRRFCAILIAPIHIMSHNSRNRCLMCWYAALLVPFLLTLTSSAAVERGAIMGAVVR